MSDDDRPTYVDRGQEFERDTDYIPDRITRDGARVPEHGPVEGELWPVEPGRYRLVAAQACPWANRAIIVRRLLGLEDVISLGSPGPTHDERSWTFDLDPGGGDPVLGIERLQEAYFARFPDYDRGHHGAGDRRRADRRRWSPTTSRGSPTTSSSSGATTTAPTRPTCGPPTSARRWRRSCSGSTPRSTTASTAVGSPARRRRTTRRTTGSGRRMDWLEERLADRRYLMGDAITEADVRLFTTLARFDAVYHGHFKCNRHKLTEMPALWGYARDLFQTPGFGDNIDFDQIKQHYYVVHQDINPTRHRARGPRPVRLAGAARPRVTGGKPIEAW